METVSVRQRWNLCKYITPVAVLLTESDSNTIGFCQRVCVLKLDSRDIKNLQTNNS